MLVNDVKVSHIAGSPSTPPGMPPGGPSPHTPSDITDPQQSDKSKFVQHLASGGAYSPVTPAEISQRSKLVAQMRELSCSTPPSKRRRLDENSPEPSIDSLTPTSVVEGSPLSVSKSSSSSWDSLMPFSPVSYEEYVPTESPANVGSKEHMET